MVDALSTRAEGGPFPVAESAVARHPDVILAPRELRRWIEQLPLANPSRAAQELLLQLRLVARDPQPGPRLSDLLDVFSEPVQRLFGFVRERQQEMPDFALPLDQLEYQLLDLLAEMANGRLRVVNHVLAAGKTPSARQLFEALRLLDEAQAIGWLHYIRPRPENWRLQLQIFLHAEFQRLSDEPAVDAAPANGPAATIRQLFMRSLIINLCDPSQRLPREIVAWREWCCAHADDMALTLLPKGPFAIPLDISGERLPLDAARRAKPGPDTRYLATDGLLQRLLDDDAAPTGLYRALSDLIKGRQSTEQRQSPRQPRNHPYLLLHGLGNMHRRLGELLDGQRPSHTAPAAMPCRQINQSKSGAAFHLVGPLAQPLAVGEPILVETAASPGDGPPLGFAGRIQRLVSHADQTVEIGVEKLPGRVVPVTLTGAAADRTRGSHQALLINGPDPDAYLLLAPEAVFRVDDSVTVESASDRYNLQMRKQSSMVAQIAYIEAEALHTPGLPF